MAILSENNIDGDYLAYIALSEMALIRLLCADQHIFETTPGRTLELIDAAASRYADLYSRKK